MKFLYLVFVIKWKITKNRAESNVVASSFKAQIPSSQFWGEISENRWKSNGGPSSFWAQIPNMTYLDKSSKTEVKTMLEQAPFEPRI
jgi:hypothetical protein